MKNIKKLVSKMSLQLTQYGVKDFQPRYLVLENEKDLERVLPQISREIHGQPFAVLATDSDRLGGLRIGEVKNSNISLYLFKVSFGV